MKKILLVLLVVCMLYVSMSEVVDSISTFSVSEKMGITYDSFVSTSETGMDRMVGTISKYMNLKENSYDVYRESVQSIELPQIGHDGEIFGWWVRLEYNGETFEKELDISIDDFQEKFLKHPEYGEILHFDIDDDSDNDVEVIVGFYWSVIQNAEGSQSKSLEMRFRVRQLEGGGYIDDSDGELEVWSELHVNYGLVKNNAIDKPPTYNLKNMMIENYKSELLITKLINQIFGQKKNVNFLLTDIFRNILSRFQQKNLDDEPLLDVGPLAADNDYFSMGAGYRSPGGVDIPRFTEKRFAFAKDNIFNPTIFQHEMDPGSSKGKGPIELLYGFRSFKEGDSIDNPSYDIAFSVEFDPAVYLKTKFVPLGGYVYYYFNQDSQQNSDSKITFSSDIIKGSGESIELSLIFDKIDSSLGQSGKWMSFDIDVNIFGRGDLVGFHYKASHKFTVSIVVSAPQFEEKVKIKGIPKSVDFGWNVDVDLIVLPHTIDISFGGSVELDMSSNIDDVIVYYPKFDPDDSDAAFIHASDIPSYEKLSAEASLYIHNGSMLTVTPAGYVDLTMSSQFGEINVYYPKAESIGPDTVFISIPEGIPSSVRVSAEATLHIDLDDLLNPANYIYGKIEHDCSSNFDELDVFLPGEELPIVKITDVPSYSKVNGQLYWNKLQGSVYALRSSSGSPDPIEINLEYTGFALNNVLEIRDGHISLGFRVAEDGYFNFDTSKTMFANTLHVVNDNTGDELTLIVDEVSADNLQADWNIDTSGDNLKINNLKFGGIIDTLRGLKLDLKYEGKTTAFNLDWVLGQEGQFDIEFDQGSDTTIDFDLGKNSNVFDFRGSVTLSQKLQFDMNWQFRQGSSTFDPGHFTINEFNDGPNLKQFNLYFTYQGTYGVEIDFYNFKVYLDLEWWKGDRILPYVWLDYEVGISDLDVDLLWNGEWYYNIEDW